MCRHEAEDGPYEYCVNNEDSWICLKTEHPEKIVEWIDTIIIKHKGRVMKIISKLGAEIKTPEHLFWDGTQ